MNGDDPFHVPLLLHFLGGCVQVCRGAFLALGRLESHVLESELGAIEVTMPIFVCGLARSGSTLLHLALSRVPGVGTHRAKDYPLVYTPHWWRQATKSQPGPPRERAHGDRVMITSDSPEALEEMIWMAYFRDCHDPRVSNALNAEVRQPDFESFYATHIRKLLLTERATRYVAKANYHIARLPYLLRLFPDARFVIPIRDPVSHIASLVRQHQRFCEGERRHPRALAHMQRAGHFEFGLDRRPINLGDRTRVEEIEQAWQRGEEVLGWAKYWAMVHDYLADLLESDVRVRAATIVVRYESVCDAPAKSMDAVLRHCVLEVPDDFLQDIATGVRASNYYASPLSSLCVELIQQVTAVSASRWATLGK
jgi:hypothetical protein